MLLRHIRIEAKFLMIDSHNYNDDYNMTLESNLLEGLYLMREERYSRRLQFANRL